jgi:hypothetical protein
MPTQCSRDLFGYEVVAGRQVVAAFDGGEVTSDAGGLLLGATDRAIGLRRGSRRVSVTTAPRRRSSTRSRRWWCSACSASRSGTRT